MAAWEINILTFCVGHLTHFFIFVVQGGTECSRRIPGELFSELAAQACVRSPGADTCPFTIIVSFIVFVALLNSKGR